MIEWILFARSKKRIRRLPGSIKPLKTPLRSEHAFRNVRFAFCGLVVLRFVFLFLHTLGGVPRLGGVWWAECNNVLFFSAFFPFHGTCNTWGGVGSGGVGGVQKRSLSCVLIQSLRPTLLPFLNQLATRGVGWGGVM